HPDKDGAAALPSSSSLRTYAENLTAQRAAAPATCLVIAAITSLRPGKDGAALPLIVITADIR
ncbi:MAG: hypothetical protein LBL36_07820, partial [Clostridiales Family XIII bacterium]|nr:hypothetical protein [Clostridiales Family XIII bacterium]